MWESKPKKQGDRTDRAERKHPKKNRRQKEGARKKPPEKKFPLRLVIYPAIALLIGGALFFSNLPETGPPRERNERNAVSILRHIAEAQNTFWENDPDGNEVKDYWVGDVSGLRYNLDRERRPLDLILPRVAGADYAPISRRKPVPERGYYFATVPINSAGKQYGLSTNAVAYAVCAWPVEHGMDGQLTFIMSERLIVWKKNRRRASRIMEWPRDPEAEGWTKVE